MNKHVVLAAAGTGALLVGVALPAQAVAPPQLGFTVSSPQDFGQVVVGSSATKTFTLTNPGGSATSALAVTLTPTGAFTIPAGGDKCTGLSLAANNKKTCTITVTYTPATAGASDTATLTASAKKPPAPATLTLTGSGTGQCWSGFFDGAAEGDLLFVGPINAVDNGHFYLSTDGTCTGETNETLTLVQANTEPDASAICKTLISGPYTNMIADTIVAGGYATAPADYWFCTPVYF